MRDFSRSNAAHNLTKDQLDQGVTYFDILQSDLDNLKIGWGARDMATALSVEHLHFDYGPVEVLHDVTFDVERGDYVILAGPNGGGKTH